MKSRNPWVWLQIIASVTFLVAFLFHSLSYFDDFITIDILGATLLFMVFVPWIARYISKIGINGIGSVELRNLKKEIEEKTNSIPGFEKSERAETPLTYEFEEFEYSNVPLALSLLRKEIEVALRNIADEKQLNLTNRSLMAMGRILSEKRLIDPNAYEVLRDIGQILNAAVHGEKLNYSNYTWIFDYGRKILNYLNSLALSLI
jgi:hypothetical protein